MINKWAYRFAILLYCFATHSAASVKTLSKDPTKPKVLLNSSMSATKIKVLGPRLKLQAVTIVGDTRRAVINGKVLAEGDKLTDTIKVLQVTLGKVIISHDGKHKTLRLNRANVKKESK